MVSLIFLVFISLINLTSSWLTEDQMSRLAGFAFGADGADQFKMFRMILNNVNDQNQFITRILNPAEVNRIYTYFGGEAALDEFTFVQTGAPVDLLDFYRNGDTPKNIVPPTSSGTWDPSVHGRTLDSRRNSETIDNNMGIYRSLFADPDFPIITLTYNIRDVSNINFDSAVAQRLGAAATYSGDDRAASKLVMPPLQQAVCYYDTSATQNHLDFLNTIYTARKGKPVTYADYAGDPAAADYKQVGVADALAGREVVFRGGKTPDVDNSWTIAAAQLAYITLWSYDPSQTRTAYVAVDNVLKYTLAAVEGAARAAPAAENTPIPAAARLAIKYFTIKPENRATIKNYCAKFLYLYPNVQTYAEGAYIGWKPFLTAQKAARVTLLEDVILNEFITSEAIKTKLELSHFQSSLFATHSKIHTQTQSDEAQLRPQFCLTMGNRKEYFVDEFEAVWKVLWMGDNRQSPASVVVVSETIESRLKKFLDARKKIKDLKAIWTKFYQKWGRNRAIFTDELIAEYELPELPALADFLEMDEEMGQNDTKEKQIPKKSQDRLMP